MSQQQRPLRKNDELTLSVTGLGSQAEGICRHQGQVIFVPGALPGETIEARILRVEKRHAYGKLQRVLSASAQRVTPPCPYYLQCGGCSCQHMDYDAELAFKRQQVDNVMRRIGGLELDVQPVLGMEEPWAYRNKTAMPVVMDAREPVAGFFARRSHRVIPVERCLIAQPQSDKAAAIVLKWMKEQGVSPYDEQTHSGLIRHIMTRVNRQGETMVVLATNGTELPHEANLIELLRAELPGFVSLCISENHAQTNVILGRGYACLWGVDRLEDTLCGSHFLLSPLSFFQINSSQAEVLYQTALSLAQPKPDDKVIDLYCGAGTISSLFARHAGEVLGIESVPQAVADAKDNAKRNGLNNLQFICGLSEEVLPQVLREGFKPDIIVLDPPRKGADPKALDAVIHAAPPKVVYISCHPATQARDAKVLVEAGYRVTNCTPVDMFCRTPDVENILLLEK